MRDLHPEHPDAENSPGDERTFDGLTYRFGKNQYSSFWRAGPKDGTVVCSKDYPVGSEYPYVAGGYSCRTFEDAAKRARSKAKAEYERALEIVRRYEQEG